MKKPTKKIIIDALVENHSILVNAAQSIGCTRQALKKWIDEDPELTEGYLLGKEKLKDIVEGQLLKNILDGKETSLIWYMKTQMRDRNYKDSQDVSMTIDAVKIKYIMPTEENNLLDNPSVKIIDTSNDKLLNE